MMGRSRLLLLWPGVSPLWKWRGRGWHPPAEAAARSFRCLWWLADQHGVCVRENCAQARCASAARFFIRIPGRVSPDEAPRGRARDAGQFGRGDAATFVMAGLACGRVPRGAACCVAAAGERVRVGGGMGQGNLNSRGTVAYLRCFC